MSFAFVTYTCAEGYSADGTTHLESKVCQLFLRSCVRLSVVVPAPKRVLWRFLSCPFSLSLSMCFCVFVFFFVFVCLATLCQCYPLQAQSRAARAQPRRAAPRIECDNNEIDVLYSTPIFMMFVIVTYTCAKGYSADGATHREVNGCGLLGGRWLCVDGGRWQCVSLCSLLSVMLCSCLRFVA